MLFAFYEPPYLFNICELLDTFTYRLLKAVSYSYHVVIFYSVLTTSGRTQLPTAFLHNSPIYILDEATSNIDVESEEAIMAAVCGIARYKAVILISHRLANVTAARRIYVLEHGRVVGEGDHSLDRKSVV